MAPAMRRRVQYRLRQGWMWYLLIWFIYIILPKAVKKAHTLSQSQKSSPYKNYNFVMTNDDQVRSIVPIGHISIKISKFVGQVENQ